MPLIEAKVQRGALSDEQLDDLATRLTEVASDAEGSDLEKAKPVTWVTVDEYDRGHWQVGGERSDDPRYLIHAHLAAGIADEAGKDHLVAGMTDAVREVVGEDAFVPMACWVVVDEVPSRHWGAGGSRLSSAEIANVVGAELAEAAPEELEADDD
ncbi:tautomerase family protein [Salinirubellus salinus]|uniref:Tautomerase family protein n=1 Tax=Salinirubellus salinus TaxID=1364945 RepID=A0A9E7UAI5_9EURY|nr:tautomerase family protein [Salinirubellus salinus]UWM53809.1 tautomerase family protein [Salinirubellus salinus]